MPLLLIHSSAGFFVCARIQMRLSLKEMFSWWTLNDHKPLTLCSQPSQFLCQGLHAP
jgi:hypothetical protein